MISLTRGAAIPDVHTSFTRLETTGILLAALSAAGICRHSIHDFSPTIFCPPTGRVTKEYLSKIKSAIQTKVERGVPA
jgi:hypothetical protein